MLIVPSIKHCLYTCSNSNRFCQRRCEIHAQSCCNCLSGSNEKLDQFLKAFYGCYKDGTGGDIDGKIDYRWFAGLYFALRIVMLALYAFTPDWVFQLVLQQITCIGMLLAFLIFRPYKNDLYNKLDAIFFGILAVLCSLSIQNYYSSVAEAKMPLWTFVIQYILFPIPLVYLTTYIAFWTLCKLHSKCKSKLKLVRNSEDNDLHDILEIADSKQAEIENSPHLFAPQKNDLTRPLLTNEQMPSLDSTPRTNSEGNTPNQD